MLASLVQDTLGRAGYQCRLSTHEPNTLWFEDDSLLGFVSLFDSPLELLNLWRERQASFIQRNSDALRRASTKSWNCYAVLLCCRPIESSVRSQLLELEEDLSLTRKIVADGIATQADVEAALLPILPIQSQTTDIYDNAIDLSKRLEGWPTKAISALQGSGTAADLIELLLEAK